MENKPKVFFKALTFKLLNFYPLLNTCINNLVVLIETACLYVLPHGFGSWGLVRLSIGYGEWDQYETSLSLRFAIHSVHQYWLRFDKYSPNPLVRGGAAAGNFR